MTTPRVAPELMWASPVMQEFEAEFAKATIRSQLRRVVDPQIVEITRLRCASYHDCRLCAACRTLDAELDDSIASKVMRSDTSDFPEAWKVALRLTDAMIMAPALVDEELRADVRRHFNDDQISQMIFSIMKWSCQKGLVSLRVDIPPEEGMPVIYNSAGERFFGAAAVAEYEMTRQPA